MTQTATQPAEGPSELDTLAQTWRELKAAEDDVRKRRIAAEESIIALIGVAEEGTTTEKTAFFTIKTVGKLTRSLDAAAWDAIREDFPAALAPVAYKPSLDLRQLRALEKANPALYAKACECITTKPAKPAVSVELLEG